eukprot:jgi/Chrzof1/15025/Cz09g24120.t1
MVNQTYADTLQYACLFLSAGEPGNLKKIQTSVTAARKVFRVMRPLEALTPVLLAPNFSGRQPWQVETITKLKDILMAIYFAADHVVWAFQIGLVTDKTTGERAQKVSLWGWALGSVCTILLEANGIAQASARRLPNEGDVEWAKRQEAARKEINQRLLVLVHGLVQALTAVGLLQLLPFKPRTVGLLGTVASAINCYMLLPAFPARPPKPADVQPATALGVLPADTCQAPAKVISKVA